MTHARSSSEIHFGKPLISIRFGLAGAQELEEGADEVGPEDQALDGRGAQRGWPVGTAATKNDEGLGLAKGSEVEVLFAGLPIPAAAAERLTDEVVKNS